MPNNPPVPSDIEGLRQKLEAQLTAARSAVSALITTGALYTPIAVKVDLAEVSALMALVSRIIPEYVERECGCGGGRTRWIRDSDQMRFRTLGSPLMLEYQCRNCERAHLYVVLRFLESQVVKVGQFPQPEVRPSKRLERALGPNAALYRKALTARHNGYGIGAVAYLRRIVEETIDTLLALLRDVLTSEPGNEARVKRVDEVKQGRVFDDKIKLARDILPSRLCPGGVNPFGLLHDLFSVGLHRLPEEDALRIADRAIGSLAYLFTELVIHVEERKAFVADMKGLQELQQETRGST